MSAGLFTSLLEKTRSEPARFARLAGQLFEAMAGGGDFGLEPSAASTAGSLPRPRHWIWRKKSLRVWPPRAGSIGAR